ncbi:intraflagellar transport protein 57 homolog [Trichogramma pretiosum]|uniref:intraflagellar transport protein 57 homolog n=1 Tax=Trichogramma pretiosum TaxID=7493 RepID=UPI0006C9BB2C|nr:intraflagellar transport protein 57 homolog [Trichogramma pretiosum]
MFRESPKVIIEDPDAPSATFAANIRMEDLLEKLKLLNYDTEFVQKYKMKYISRHYFMVPTNPGEQFFMFTSLAAWLIRKAGKNFDPPQESDDPNATIAQILDFMKSIDAAVDFPPNKLKQGVGEHAVFVLDHLADNAIKVSKFKWQKSQIPPDETEVEPELEEDDAELILEKVEEEMVTDYDDEEDDAVHVDNINKFYRDSSHATQKPDKILESTVDAEEWKLELEKVLPQLKLNIDADSRDWQAHLEHMKSLHASMTENLSGTKGQLDKLYIEIGRTFDKINNREIELNRQLQPQLQELRVLQEQLLKVKEKYRDISGGVQERTKSLNKLTDELEQVKKEMDERGASMTDGTPLINIKKTVGKMKSEISEMSLRIGVLEYSLMCSRVRDRVQLQEDMKGSTGNVALY